MIDPERAIHDPVSGFAGRPFGDLVADVASADPTPGAGPSLAWTCALAAGLVEMVNAVMLRRHPEDPHPLAIDRDRAAAIRRLALSLADIDAEAYGRVIAAQRRRGEPGHGERLRQAFLDAANPLVSIIEAAAELAHLAADATDRARGGVRGEAITAVVLSSAVVDAGVPMVRLNLASAPDDPRLPHVQELSAAVERHRVRALGT